MKTIQITNEILNKNVENKPSRFDMAVNFYCCPFCTEYCLGNIITENLSNIWNNKNRFLFLDKLAKSKKYNNRMCLVAQKGDLND